MYKHLTATIFLLLNIFPIVSLSGGDQWSVTVDYLYFKPSVDDTYFVIKSPEYNISDEFVGEEKNNRSDFSSGYRLGGAFAFCDCQSKLAVFYTYLSSDHKRRIYGNELTPTIGIENFEYDMAEYSGVAKSKLSSSYQRVDALYAHKSYENNNLDLHIILGLEYADLEVHQHTDYLPDSLESSFYSSEVKQKTSTYGIGPQIGFDFSYDLCRLPCYFNGGVLSVDLITTASLLLSEAKAATRINYTNIQEVNYPFNIRQEKTAKMIPAFHVAVSLNYNCCLFNREANIGLGYEFNTYLRSLLNSKITSYYGYGLTNRQYNDFDLQGLVASFSVKY